MVDLNVFLSYNQNIAHKHQGRVNDLNDKWQNEILSILKENGKTSVKDLAEKTYTSLSTLKRRLNKLQDMNLVIRSHGYVTANDGNVFLTSFSYRVKLNIAYKTEIALKAVKLIKNGDVIFLDGSSSCFYMLPYLKEFENLTVITNGIDLLCALSSTHIKTYSTGGKISELNKAVLSGTACEKFLNETHADICFFSAMGLNEKGIVSDNSEEEASVRREMIKNSTKKVFLCDETKLNLSKTFKICTATDLDYIVSNLDLKDYFTTKPNTILL